MSTHLQSHRDFRVKKVVFSLWMALFVCYTTWQSAYTSGNTATTAQHSRLLGQVDDSANDKFVQETLDRHLPLFHVSDFTVLGPTVFPKPNEKARKLLTGEISGTKIVNHLKPTFGQHRSDQDAIMVFAAEYDLRTYILFLSSLRETGYAGDVVMAISKIDYDNNQVREFLQRDPYVIAYVINFTCFNAEQQAVESSKGGIRVCQCPDLYGALQADGSIQPLPDPRPPRTVPTTRYELYWIWAQNYQPHSWLMLIDARDTVFQSNPFARVPRDSDRPDGILFFFGENMEATRIGKSPKNKKWLTNAYGSGVAEKLLEKPTICSGSTMGEQVALDMYLRAMVGEFDETRVVLMGADQGFHNYLYYSQKLGNANAIRHILVQDQGNGIINNLGALRTQELDQWGNGKLVEETEIPNSPSKRIRVLNWDGEPSPVVHQFDRHKLLSRYWYKRKTTQYVQAWDRVKNDQQYWDKNSIFPVGT